MTGLLTRPSTSTWTISMDRAKHSRRIAMISLALSALGRSHCISLKPFDFASNNYILKHAASKAECSLTWRSTHATDVLITDSPAFLAQRETARQKTIMVRFTEGLIDNPDGQRQFFVPLLFHPKLISTHDYERARLLSKNRDRPIKILFAGNCNAKSYSRQQPFGLHNRLEFQQAVMALPQDQVSFPNSGSELEQLISSGKARERLIWVNTERFRIPQEQWLDFLSLANYVICPPGAHRPYCHNLSEAMACGSVPILQHSSLYAPALSDGENCIYIPELSQFRDIISNLLLDDNSKWNEMSHAAWHYHQDRLSLLAIWKEIEKFISDSNTYTIDWIMAGRTH